MNIKVSGLPKTWLFDLDGTIVVHNGYLHGGDILIEGVKYFFDMSISKEDKVIILTSRKRQYEEETICFLRQQGIRYDQIIFELPMGERFIINDKKPSGLLTAYAINTERDCIFSEKIIVDENL